MAESGFAMANELAATENTDRRFAAPDEITISDFAVHQRKQDSLCNGNFVTREIGFILAAFEKAKARRSSRRAFSLQSSAGL